MPIQTGKPVFRRATLEHGYDLCAYFAYGMILQFVQGALSIVNLICINLFLWPSQHKAANLLGLLPLSHQWLSQQTVGLLLRDTSIKKLIKN